MKLNYKQTFLLGFGFLGVSVIWTLPGFIAFTDSLSCQGYQPCCLVGLRWNISEHRTSVNLIDSSFEQDSKPLR